MGLAGWEPGALASPAPTQGKYTQEWGHLPSPPSSPLSRCVQLQVGTTAQETIANQDTSIRGTHDVLRALRMRALQPRQPPAVTLGVSHHEDI